MIEIYYKKEEVCKGVFRVIVDRIINYTNINIPFNVLKEGNSYVDPKFNWVQIYINNNTNLDIKITPIEVNGVIIKTTNVLLPRGIPAVHIDYIIGVLPKEQLPKEYFKRGKYAYLTIGDNNTHNITIDPGFCIMENEDIPLDQFNSLLGIFKECALKLKNIKQELKENIKEIPKTYEQKGITLSF